MTCLMIYSPLLGVKTQVVKECFTRNLSKYVVCSVYVVFCIKIVLHDVQICLVIFKIRPKV